MKMWKAATLSVRTLFFPMYTASVCLLRDLHSTMVKRQMPPFSASRALILRVRATAGPGRSGQPIAAPHYDAGSIYSM